MIKDKKKSERKLLIIGGGAVGMAVSTGAKRHSNYDVTVISMDKHASYSQCGIPYALAEEVESFEILLMNKPSFFKDMGIDLRLNTEVETIDLNQKCVYIKNEKLDYDKLVIATGSKPFIPETLVKSANLKNIFTLRTYTDGILIDKALKSAENLVIIGAGLIGVEVAIAAAKRRIKTYLLNRSNTILSSLLDPDMAEILISYLENKGVIVITGHSPTSINGNKKVSYVEVNDYKIPADVILIAAGLIPEVSLAKNAGVDIGSSGSIITNEHLQVISKNKVIEDVFAGGECTQVYNFVTNTPMTSYLATTSRRMANTIVNNLSNPYKTTFKPITNPTVAVIGELQIGSVGITTLDAKKNGIKVISGIATGYNKARYFLDSEKIYIKLLFHERYIVGAQIISKTGVKERIDNMTLAIKKKCTIEELLEIETSYSPIVATLEDPLLFAVKGAYKKMQKNN